MRAWEAAGWTTRPRNGREWRAFYLGAKEPVRRVGRVPPCRVCRGKDFTLAYRLGKLYRKCLRCANRRAKGIRRDPVRGPKLRAEQATWARAKRALRRQEEHRVDFILA